MKHSFKQLAVGAMLGLAMWIGGVGQAQATFLDGHVVDATILNPNVSTVESASPDCDAPFSCGPALSGVIGGGLEYDGFGPFDVIDIDLGGNSIVITANFTPPFPFTNNLFNGVRIRDIFDTLPDWQVSLVGSTLGGFDSSRLTFDANQIFINVAGLQAQQGNTITLDVKPVPEPSTMILLGTGLAGVIGWRYRKHQA